MKEEFRDPDRTTKVTVRFLNEGWQDKIRRALQMTRKNRIRDSIATAFSVLVPHHMNLTHGELAEVIDQIASGTYTLETALDEQRKMREHKPRVPQGAPQPSRVSSYLEEMRRANEELLRST